MYCQIKKKFINFHTYVSSFSIHFYMKSININIFPISTFCRETDNIALIFNFDDKIYRQKFQDFQNI